MSRYTLIILLLLLTACGGNSSSPLGDDSSSTPPPGHGAVEIVVDESRRVSATILPSGGSLKAEGGDGTIFELVFPAEAVAAETQVSIAPIISISGTSFDDSVVAALDLKPDGLILNTAAQLYILPLEAISGDLLALGMHMASTGEEADFWPVEAAPEGYLVEIDHFSVAGLLWLIEDEWMQLVENGVIANRVERLLDKYYGPFGLVASLQASDSCNDHNFGIFEQTVVEVVKLAEVFGIQTAPAFWFDSPRQCGGYLGGAAEYCSNVDELKEAAEENLRVALKHFTRTATDKCSSGEISQEGEAARCIERAELFAENGFHVVPSSLCSIKAECGIATLEVNPADLALRVGDSGQLEAKARDQAGNELRDREMWWEIGDENIAKLSDVAARNPYAEGLTPGVTAATAYDEITANTLCKDFAYRSATVRVGTDFVTDAESIIIPEGDSATLGVKLAHQPEMGVRASVTVSGDSSITIAAGTSLDFKPENWDRYQMVRIVAAEDDDVLDGGAVVTITDTRVIGGAEAVEVSTKHVPIREADNDAPSMVVTPDRLCVETSQMANLSVIGNEFVDLNAIEWSSSDLTVAQVGNTGVVSAFGIGPAQITARMIVEGETVAEAYSRLEVREQCAQIVAPTLTGKTCIHAASNAAFKPLRDSVGLEAILQTPQDGHTTSWTTPNVKVLALSSTGNDAAQAVGNSGGSALVEITVDNVVTEYRAQLLVDVVSFPDEYSTASLTLPYAINEPHALNDNREIISNAVMTQTLSEAIGRCNVVPVEQLEFMHATSWHESGKVIGEYVTSVTSQGFVFDINTCNFDFLSASFPFEPGDTVQINTRPTAISGDGTIVGTAEWNVYGDWCDINPDWSCTYHTEAAFIFESGQFSYPFLDVSVQPYELANQTFSHFDALNDNRVALGYAHSQHGVENAYFLYYLDLPIAAGNPELLPVGGHQALDDHGHVVGTDILPWVYSNGAYAYLTASVPGGSATPFFPDQINEQEDILAYGGQESSLYNYYLLYLCPLPVESPSREHLEDPTLLEGYEETEVTCDGRDNDLDGLIDNSLSAPTADKQAGVCAGARKTCEGPGGWVNDYTKVQGVEFPEQSCDGLDNDCDGLTDENCQ